jgi:CRISPR-associated protein Csb2
MFAIRIDLLTGRYAATAYNDRDQVEWPPHPARLFSAMVATWAEGQPGSEQGDAELAALRWLEAQAPPTIVASPIARVGIRSAATVFVPVNDVGVIKVPDHTKLEAAERALAEAREPAARAKATKQLATVTAKLQADTAKEIAVPAKFGKHDAAGADQTLLDRRVRQPRTFPCAVPEVAAFAFAWDDAEPPVDVVAALSRLAERLVRLGHSSSMVHARVMVVPPTDELTARTARFVVDDQDGDVMIRWVGPGQTERLIHAHTRHQQVEPRVLPARFIRYREGARRTHTPAVRGVFDGRDDNWIVYARSAGPRLPITSAAGLSRQFRRALMSVADEAIPEIVSGHQPDGAPSESVHVAVVPLPFVMGRYADGTLLGLALLLPRAISEDSRRAVMRAVGRLERHGMSPEDDTRAVTLELGQVEPLVLKRTRWGDGPRTVQPSNWARPSQRWASATPVALDRNPGDLHDRDPAARARAFEEATASIIEAVARIGLPPPSEVDVVRSCVLPGTAKPRTYPRFPSDAHKQQRVLVHVRIGFSQPVGGPVLIGAGRYQGLGLCLPVDGSPTESS